MDGPLEGVRVLEVASHGFVPSCTAALGDWGADVVKLEHPNGDPMRDVMRSGLVVNTGDFDFLWEAMNRNKRGVSLDLRNAQSRPVFERLVQWADVFVTNYLPQIRRKLNTDLDDVRAINPKVIWAVGHGQGQRGPDAEAGGFDAVSFWSRGGIGHMLTPPHGPLVMQRGAMGDGPSGLWLAGGIAAALFARERTGEAMTVDLSLLAGACWTLQPDLVSTSILGEDPAKFDTTKGLPNPCVGARRTADERWVMLNMLDGDKYWPNICRVMGREDLIEKYPGAADRAAAAEDLNAAIDAIFAAQPLAYWEDRLRAEACIYSKMQTPLEVLDDPQVVANGYLPRHPAHPKARLAASPQQFDGEMVRIRRRAPELGEHTDEVLAALGVGDAERGRLREVGAIR